MSELDRKIYAAIYDPGAVVGRRHGPTWGEGNDGYAEIQEDLPDWQTRAVVETIRRHLVYEPCHVTGMHNPGHHLTSTCQIQTSVVFGRLLRGLGLTRDDLPNRLHNPDCGWCHRVPDREAERERLRATHRWAGVPVPDALAEPGEDVLRPGDCEAVLAAFPAEWTTWWGPQSLVGRLAETTGMPHAKVNAAILKLLRAGQIQEGIGTVRRTPAEEGETH